MIEWNPFDKTHDSEKKQKKNDYYIKVINADLKKDDLQMKKKDNTIRVRSLSNQS